MRPIDGPTRLSPSQRPPAVGAASASSRAAGSAASAAPGLSTERGPVPRGRIEPLRVDPARVVASVTPAEARARLRATMPAHIAAAARVARVTPRATKTLESGELEIVYNARWGLLRGWPCLTWNESTRELSVSVKRFFRETLVHTFPVRSPEHFGVIAQTAMSLVVGRAK